MGDSWRIEGFGGGGLEREREQFVEKSSQELSQKMGEMGKRIRKFLFLTKNCVNRIGKATKPC